MLVKKIIMASVSLREIALQAGCSRSAVSYALRNSPNISKDLRERVQKLAAQMGWRPDPNMAAQMAITRHTQLAKNAPRLAIIIQKSTAQLELESAPRMQLTGAIEYVRMKGFQAEVYNLGDSPLRAERLFGILQARGIQGVIFIATLCPSLPEEYLHIGKNFACVVVGTPETTLPYHCVNNDIVFAGRLGLQTLRIKGYRKIGVILPRGVDVPLGHAYTAGFAAGYSHFPDQERSPILYVGSNESCIVAKDFPEVKEWVSQVQPNAILTTDTKAVATLKGSFEKKLPPGWNFDLFSADLSPGQPVLGGVELRQKKLGEVAVDVVVAQIHRGSIGIPDTPRAICVRPLWVDGADYDPDGLSAISA